MEICAVKAVLHTNAQINLRSYVLIFFGDLDKSRNNFFQITNLMHNSFILQQYVCYITILNMFRAAPCSSSGGQIVLLQPLVSSLSVKAVQYAG